jgi:hypothetical protein
VPGSRPTIRRLPQGCGWYKVRMARRVTQDNCGAWLLRCNPANDPDLPQLIAGGGHRIGRWCVADNYRSRMMNHGDVVIFWVSGNGRRLARGIWGIGQVLGVYGFDQPADDGAVAGELGSPDRRPRVRVDIPLLTEPVSDEALRGCGINDLEVQVQPQGSNPSWVSTDQLARMMAMVPSLRKPETFAGFVTPSP